MRQAHFEEGFMTKSDVLQELGTTLFAGVQARTSKARAAMQTEVERSEATDRGSRGLGPPAIHLGHISQKVEIIVEHYQELVSPLLDGKAKAMVVVGSRLEAVRWQLAMDKYIKSRGYGLKTLVAFSVARSTTASLGPSRSGRRARR